LFGSGLSEWRCVSPYDVDHWRSQFDAGTLLNNASTWEPLRRIIREADCYKVVVLNPFRHGTAEHRARPRERQLTTEKGAETMANRGPPGRPETGPIPPLRPRRSLSASPRGPAGCTDC
jgi:hypothetical protein